VPSFFLIKNQGNDHGESALSMYPSCSFSSKNFFVTSCSANVNGYTLQLIVSSAPGTNLMAWSSSLEGGKRVAYTSENTL
jgi:hypothetical protein